MLRVLGCPLRRSMSEAAEEADDIVTRVPQVFQLLKRLVQGSSTVARDHGTCTTGVIHKSREFRSSRIRFDDAIAPACAPTVLPPGDSGAAAARRMSLGGSGERGGERGGARGARRDFCFLEGRSLKVL